MILAEPTGSVPVIVDQVEPALVDTRMTELVAAYILLVLLVPIAIAI